MLLDDGSELTASTVVTAVHPKIAFLDHLDRDELPRDLVDDIEGWKSRSGTVKINLAIDRLPEFTADPGFDPLVPGLERDPCRRRGNRDARTPLLLKDKALSKR